MAWLPLAEFLVLGFWRGFWSGASGMDGWIRTKIPRALLFCLVAAWQVSRWMDGSIDGMVVAGIAFCFMELRQRILYDLETI